MEERLGHERINDTYESFLLAPEALRVTVIRLALDTTVKKRRKPPGVT